MLLLVPSVLSFLTGSSGVIACKRIERAMPPSPAAGKIHTELHEDKQDERDHIKACVYPLYAGHLLTAARAYGKWVHSCRSALW